MSKTFFPLILVFMLVLITLWVFYPGLHGSFVFDDWSVLVQADYIKKPSAWLSGYRPIRNLSYIFDLQFGQMSPYTFHVSNLIYHLANILLLYVLIIQIFKPNSLADYLLPLGLTAIFALHPVQLDSVTYISGRRDLLFTFFYLTGLVSFLWFKQKGKIGFAWTCFIVCNILSIGSKESGITMVILLSAILLYKRDSIFKFSLPINTRSSALNLSFKILLLILIITTSCTIILYIVTMAMPALQAKWMGDNFLVHLLNCALLIIKHIKIAIWPHPLAADFSKKSFEIINSCKSIQGFAAILSILIMTCAAIFTFFDKTSYQKNGVSIIALGWLWFMITLLPMSNIVPHLERFALHYLYLPITGIFMMIAGVFISVFDQKAKKAAIAGILLLVASSCFALKTRHELAWWLNGTDFWQHNVNLHPECIRARTNLGIALIKVGHMTQAKEMLKSTVKTDSFPQTYLGLSMIAIDEQKFDEAFNYLKYVPSDKIFKQEKLFLSGMIYLAQNNLNKALEISQTLCRKWPLSDSGFYLAGSIFKKQKDYNNALKNFKKAFLLNRFSKRNSIALFRSLIYSDKLNEALLHIENSIKVNLLNMDSPILLNDFGCLMKLMGNKNKALMYWEKSLELDASHLMSALNLTKTLLQDKKFQTTINIKESVDLTKGDVKMRSKLWNNFGIAYIQIDKKQEAKKAMIKSLELWKDNKKAKANLERLNSLETSH